MFDNRANKNYTLTQFLGFFLSKLGRNLQLRSRDLHRPTLPKELVNKKYSIKKRFNLNVQSNKCHFYLFASNECLILTVFEH